MVGLADIREAARRIAAEVHRTRLDHSETFSRRTGLQVYLKPENLQKTGSFKIRGATNHILRLDSRRARCGVVTASSGNHGQAVARAASRSGYPALVVMPENASPVKVAAARGYGAEVLLHGTTSAERTARARELAAERGLTFIHAFDDPWVVAGQGTVGLEILEDLPDVDAVLVPVGGGGLLAGVATAVRESRPRVRVFGVEPAEANSLQRSLQAGAITALACPHSIADGLLPTQPGELGFHAARRYLEDVLLVDDREIAEAVVALLARARMVVEPSGAATVAALLAGRVPMRSGRVVAILSGGNVELTKLIQLVKEG